MANRIYWRDIWRSIRKTKARFFSIVSLMALGSFALVGLKVAGPNLEQTGAAFLNQYQVADLIVMADFGLGEHDQDELKSLDKATVSFGYLQDVLVKDQEASLRVFSLDKTLSQPVLVEGHLPKTDQEIALSANLAEDYQLGDTITFESDDDGTLTADTYTVSGFIKASDIWSETSFGASQKGSGELDGYAMADGSAFDAEVYSLARLRFEDLEDLNPFDSTYQKGLAEEESALEDLLADNGMERLKEIKEEPEAEIAKGQKELDDLKEQLDGQEKALKALGRSASDVPELVKLQETLTTEQAKLDDAQEELDELKEPTYRVSNRRTMPGGQGYQTYGSSAASISQVGNVFPVVLYFVAALVTFTTMTRFVDEERTNAGIFKALGYSRKAIRRKFIIYGLVAGTVGTLLGTLGGQFILAPMISGIISTGTVIGKATLFSYPVYYVLSLILSLISAVLPAYLIANKGLKEQTAYLLQPKPPVKGEKILLERLGFIWKRMSFTNKVTARNIFRYKQRMFMTIFGVAGSIALLYAGLGIRSSLSGISETQFGQILTYDMLVVEKEDASEADQKDLDNALNGSDIKAYLPIYTDSLTQVFPEVEDKQSLTLMVTEGRDFGELLHMRDAKTKEEHSLSSDGVVISEKLAKLYGVKAGDEISLTRDDQTVTVPVTGVVQLFTGHFVFMTSQAYEEAFEESYASDAYLIGLKANDEQAIKDHAAQFLELSAVSAVSQNLSVVEQVNLIVDSLASTMMLLVAVSILLAMVILYNLTNINVAERIRELSTIKVLGFHNKEVTLYIYRETIVLTLIGIALGLLSGHFLHLFLIEMIAPDSMMFNPQVTPEVWVIPIVTIILILAVLGWLVNHRLKKLDMLEALKANE
ncbi:ABC transporter permease [Streptococcus moroccensis]|uniref:ABC transport system permease protein n=1 Tax=Streptococcus moroccensis TaxID=1451356 RepID=A0ABT9YPG5_9STRE|nr:FtsX-like permease family protein [Streptococcus moroccensis]MDQ0221873.1 putative ABC transport system permease protein [Streptococcus moroccensis]